MEKIEALLEFLKENEDEDLVLEDIEESTYDDNIFEVNPRMTRYGSSPTEVIENANRVRYVLDLVLGHVMDTSEIKSYDVTEKLYKTVDHALKVLLWPKDGAPDDLYPILYKKLTGKDDPPVVPEGKHDNDRAKVYQDIVNFLYHVYCDGRYSEVCAQAFDGEEVDEYREAVPTCDGEYMVLTEDEADALFEESIENYIDEFIDSNDSIPDTFKFYFDREAFKRDTEINSDRGTELGRYDGIEHYYDDYLIYRTN